MNRVYMTPIAMLVLAGACAPEQGALTWQVTFECDAARDRTAQVLVGIREGECGSMQTPLYEFAVLRDSPAGASLPPNLGPGLYAFYATALDATGLTVAHECRPVELPTEDAIALKLGGDGACRGALSGGSSGQAQPLRGLTDLCTSDDDCESGECCTTDNCGGGMCTFSCDSHDDCPSTMRCEHRVCFAQCKSDQDCANDWTCEHMGTICEAL